MNLHTQKIYLDTKLDTKFEMYLRHWFIDSQNVSRYSIEIQSKN